MLQQVRNWHARSQVAVDTIYLCAFKDMEENSPPKYMSNDLRKGFGFDKAKVLQPLGPRF